MKNNQVIVNVELFCKLGSFELVILNPVSVNLKICWMQVDFSCVNKQRELGLFKDGCMYLSTLIFFS